VEWLLFLFLNLLFFTYTPAQGTCPRNALQIGAFTNVLNAIDLTLGNTPPPVPPCCSLIAGLADLEAAVCLCTALDVNVLGINVHLPIDISVLFHACSRFAPPSFQCPFKVSARHGPSLELVMDRFLRSAWAMELGGPIVALWASRTLVRRSGTSLTSTAPEPVTCFLHHIFTFVFGGGSFRKRGMTSGGKWLFVLHPNNVIGSYVLNGGTSFESLEAKNYFWTARIHLISSSPKAFLILDELSSILIQDSSRSRQQSFPFASEPLAIPTATAPVRRSPARISNLNPVEWLLFLFLNLLFFTYTSAQGTCPRNVLQIGACTNVLNAIDLTLGNPPPPVPPCCSLIAGLADLEAAVCLCTALDINVLGINVHLPIDISVLFNACSRFSPPSFQC
uniref:Bifunctional inhibitor/plant lipid transfer protein/seed storage helical domain-containing protein n=1 Tax=Brassica oleracea var. oleracea TaxID=109376 RepID=A0A0D2ZSY0_BRAOL